MRNAHLSACGDGGQWAAIDADLLTKTLESRQSRSSSARSVHISLDVQDILGAETVVFLSSKSV